MKIDEAINFAVVIFFSILFIFVGNRIVADDIPQEGNLFAETYYTAVVREIHSNLVSDIEMGAGFWEQNTHREFYAEIIRGERRGDIVFATQMLSTMFPVQERPVSVGDRVILFHDDFADNFWLSHYVRINTIAILGIIFLALVVFFARQKGLNAIIALGFTCLSIFFVFIPAILAGRNIYITTLVICVYAIVTTLLLVIGPNKKAVSAMLGCLGGVFTAAILMAVMDGILQLTGAPDQETEFLLFLPTPEPINLRAIVFAGVILGAVGAIMDVAMSIASSLWELRLAGGVSDFKGIIKSGMTIGKDILGTMLNTLILAYLGSSLTLLLIISANATSMMDILNMEMIIIEFLRALIGSFGMLLAIPLTATICGWLYSKDMDDEKFHEVDIFKKSS